MSENILITIDNQYGIKDTRQQIENVAKENGGDLPTYVYSYKDKLTRKLDQFVSEKALPVLYKIFGKEHVLIR